MVFLAAVAAAAAKEIYAVVGSEVTTDLKFLEVNVLTYLEEN